MRSAPAGVVLTVALIQLAHLIYFDPFVSTYGDDSGYVSIADSIFRWPFIAISYQPLYPAFLRISVLLFDAQHFRRFVVLAQIGMVIATSLLIYSIALRLMKRPWLATAAALLVALDVRLTIYEYLLLTEILAIFLSVCFIHATLRALVDNNRLSPALAALSLLALALTKVSYVALTFIVSALFVLLAWRFRTAAMSAAVRRCAVGFSIAAALIAAKMIICYSYTGMIASNSGTVLRTFLSVNPEIVLRLPDGDPALAKFKESYAEHGNFFRVAERFGGHGPAADRATIQIYVRAVLSHPLGALKAALTEYYRQTSRNYLFSYPEETNYRVFNASQNVLFAIEKRLNATIFGSWPSVVWNSLCLLLGVLCLLTRMPGPQRMILALLLGFIIYTIGVTNWTVGGFYIADNSRFRLMYEAPLIVLWFFVPYRILALRKGRIEGLPTQVRCR